MAATAPAMPKKKNWFLRHKFLTAILIIIVIAIIGSMGASGDDEPAGQPTGSSSSDKDTASAGDTSDDRADNAAEDEADEPEADEAPAPELPGIGATVNTGDFDVTVTSVEPGVAAIGSEFMGAEPSGQFVIVYITVTNTANESETFSNRDHSLVDEQGRKHSTSSDSWYFDGAETFTYERINPGVTLEGALIYDIPADSEAVTLELGSDDLFGDDIPVSLK